MFKKTLFSILIAIFMCTGVVLAQDTTDVPEEAVVEETDGKVLDITPFTVPDFVEKLPDLKQGVAYDFESQDFVYISTSTVLEYKKFELEVGHATPARVVAVASYDLFTGLDLETFKFLNYLQFKPGFFVGYNFDSDDGDSDVAYGLSATILEIKF